MTEFQRIYKCSSFTGDLLVFTFTGVLERLSFHVVIWLFFHQFSTFPDIFSNKTTPPVEELHNKILSCYFIVNFYFAVFTWPVHVSSLGPLVQSRAVLFCWLTEYFLTRQRMRFSDSPLLPRPPYKHFGRHDHAYQISSIHLILIKFAPIY